MGGPGSGSHYHWWRSSTKTVVEDCLRLDANRWMREGILQLGSQRSGSWHWTYNNGRECSINFAVTMLDGGQPSLGREALPVVHCRLAGLWPSQLAAPAQGRLSPKAIFFHLFV